MGGAHRDDVSGKLSRRLDRSLTFWIEHKIRLMADDFEARE